MLSFLLSSQLSAVEVPLGPGALSATEIYNRCYIRLVRAPIPLDDVLLPQVRTSALDPVVACMRVFDKARLTAVGSQLRVANVQDSVSRSVLRTFNELHMSWFESKITNDAQMRTTNALIRDLEEPALFFTRALFAPGVRVDSVVKSEGSIRGIRQRDLSPEMSRWDSQNVFRPGRFYTKDHLAISYQVNVDANNNGFFTVEDNKITASGVLVGIEPAPPVVIPQMYHLARLGSMAKGTLPSNKVMIPRSTCLPASLNIPDPDCLAYREAAESINQNFNINQHYGGGIVGSYTYITNNSNLTKEQLPFFEDTNHRRLGANVLRDLMCLQLPALNTADVQADVQTDSEYSFRRSSSCMSCHSSMDQVASAYRNHYISNTVRAGLPGQGLSPQIVVRLPASATANVYPLQPPTGALVFRRRLMPKSDPITRVPIRGLDELGSAIANQPEFYQCIAKRYYKFFTGVNVSLTEIETEALEKEHQDMVLSLARGLQEDQSLRTLMTRIFRTPAFQTRQYRAERKQ